jgi:methyl coenzyme M reductase beta subunit
MQFDVVLRTFSDYFEREKVRYAVIGGLAVYAWGRLRPTKDADFAVDQANSKRVVTFAESLGYETLQMTSGFSNHLHTDPTFGRVDFMYLDPATAEKVFGAAVTKVILEGTESNVASPEHLAMMKALAMKNYPHRALFEGEDVRTLLNVPGVDRDAVRDYFRRHGMLDLFDAIDKTR